MKRLTKCLLDEKKHTMRCIIKCMCVTLKFKKKDASRNSLPGNGTKGMVKRMEISGFALHVSVVFDLCIFYMCVLLV